MTFNSCCFRGPETVDYFQICFISSGCCFCFPNLGRSQISFTLHQVPHTFKLVLGNNYTPQSPMLLSSYLCVWLCHRHFCIVGKELHFQSNSDYFKHQQSRSAECTRLPWWSACLVDSWFPFIKWPHLCYKNHFKALKFLLTLKIACSLSFIY